MRTLRTFLQTILASVLTLALVAPAWAQTSLTETTVSTAMTASQNYIILASATGVVPGGGIYVDREFMRVGSGYTSAAGTRIPVIRGAKAVKHAASVPVYVAPAAAFVTKDYDGACSPADEAYSPLVNTENGNIWECNSAVAKWVNLRNLTIVTCRALLTADNIDQSCFTANRPYLVYRINEVHTTAEATAGSLTLIPKKQTGTTVVGSGTALITSSFNMKGTAQTVQTATMTSTAADLILATGDRVGIDFSAGGTELAGVTVTIYLYPL